MPVPLITPNPLPTCCECTNCNTASTRLAELIFDIGTGNRRSHATVRVCREHSYSGGSILHAVAWKRSQVLDGSHRSVVDAAQVLDARKAPVDLASEYAWDNSVQPRHDGFTWSWTWGPWTLRVTADAGRRDGL